MSISLSLSLLMFSPKCKGRFSDGVSSVPLWKEGTLRLCSLLFIQTFHSCFFRYKLSHWWDSIMMLLCNYACFRLLQELGNTVWKDWRTVGNIYAFLKSWGWGHISVGRVLYMKAQGLGFGLWQPCKKPGMAMLVCNANTKKAETGESWGSFARQPCLVSKL